MILFLTIVLSVWVAMHSYVFWRLSTIPWLMRHVRRRTLVIVAILLWLSYPASRFLEGRFPDWFVLPLEYFAANWVGFLFLQVCAFLAVDVITLGGFVLRDVVGRIRASAALLAIVLGIFALVQGHRQPVVTNYQVELEGLPAERDGTVMVALSDLHLGTLIGRGWLERLVRQVNALQPDIVVTVGDVVDGDAHRVMHLPPVLRQLRAAHGVWAVTGNHEYYSGLTESIEFFEASGMRVLRDQAGEAAPGLVIAGVDDLTAKKQMRRSNDAMDQMLASLPGGATVLLSHTPWEAETAASAGVGLMISGHTHNGQIWPFSYFVRMRYPLLHGGYDIESMKVIVGRGAGTWGPRMRLWQRGEILRITLLRKAEVEGTPKTVAADVNPL